MTPEFPPALLNRFVPERALAAGGFGAVWIAWQRALDRRVAVKVLHAAIADTPAEVARFLDEARVTASLVHPGIVRLLDHGVDGRTPWMAFELLEGESLREQLRRGALPWMVAADAGEQVALALAEAHARGVVHRDVKPENILACASGRYALADFGIARFAGRTAETQTGVIMGTPAYVSPQQLLGEPASPASDLYALGVTLFELSTGRLPFVHGNAGELFEQTMNAPPPRLRTLAADAPLALEALVDRLLAKSAAERPGSAREVAGALRGLRAPSPAVATMVIHRSGLAERPARALSLPPVLVAAGVAASLVVALRPERGARQQAGWSASPPVAVAVAVAVASASPDEASAALWNELERFENAAEAFGETSVGVEEIADPAVMERTRTSLGEAAGIGRRFLDLVRRAHKYRGPSPERLLALHRLGQVLLDAAGRALRTADLVEVHLGKALNAERRELITVLERLATELAAPGHGRETTIVDHALLPFVRDTAAPTHLLAPLAHDDALVAALDEVAGLEWARAAAGLGPSLDHVLMRANVQQRLVETNLGRYTLLTAVEPGVLTMTPRRVAARDGLVAMVPGFLAVCTQRPWVPHLEVVADWLFLACALVSEDRAVSRERRLAAIRVAGTTVQHPGPRYRNRGKDLPHIGTVAARMREVATTLGDAAAAAGLAPLFPAR